MRCRILMLNNEFPPLGGGTGTVNRALLSQFARSHELEIDLITSTPGRVATREHFSERVRIFKVPVNSRNLHHASNRELVSYAARALPLAHRLQRIQPYDFTLAWSAVPAGAVALALKRALNLKYMVRVCGPDIPGFERRYGWLYPLLTPLIRLTWREAESVIAKCEDEAAMIHRVDASTEVTLIQNGVDLNAFEARRTLADGGSLRLLSVGRLIERKGQHHLIQAVKRLIDRGVNVQLTLVGTGDAFHANQAQAKALGVSDRVHFAGYIPREEIARYYADADVFVLASYNEGMSVATLEAMAASLPLVVTRTGGSSQLVEEGVNGWTFNWSDVNTLVTRVIHLARDRELVRRMGAASRDRAARFSWNSAAAEYMKIFSSMTRARSASSRPVRSIVHSGNS